MSNEEETVKAATMRLYDAIEQMISGKGLAAMREAWHHNERVTGGHPSGGWSKGWDELLATWEVFAGFGAADRGGSTVSDLDANVYGDIAYTTCVFKASPGFGGEKMACTNVLQKIDGVWKIIHHHADKSPKMGAALEKIAQGE
jgi:hypothetical protein